MKTDEELQRDVNTEFRWDPTIHPAEIGIAVKDGVVRLNGRVDSYGKKWAIVRAAMRVSCARVEGEDLKVTPPDPYRRPDEELAQWASIVLEWNVWVPHDRVKVRAQNGLIELSGNVDSYYQKERAEEAVRPLIGVLGVTNSIAIKPPGPMGDASEVRNGIEGALKRNARLLREADNITVEVSGSKAILRGSVGSWADYEEAEYSAYCAPGIAKVENNLRVTG